MAGRPPPVPGASPSGFSQGWTTTAARSTGWQRRSQSASSLRRDKSGSPDTSSSPVPGNGYQGAQGSDRLRDVGAGVVGTPPRKEWTPPRKCVSAEQEMERDAHVDCRARISTLSTELEEATQALKTLQRDHERLLRQVGNERQEHRLLQKTHSESEEKVSVANAECQRHQDEVSCLIKEREQRVARLKPWEAMEEETVARLRLSMQASEEREQHLQSTLSAEKLSGQAVAARIHEELHVHEEGERIAWERLAAAQSRELRFTQLQDEVSTLLAKSLAQDERLGKKASEFNALHSEYAEASASRDVLRREVDQYKDGIAGELNAALAELRASDQQSMEQRVSELSAERDEARRLAAGFRKGQEAAKASVKAVEKRLGVTEAAESESRAAIQARDKEMHELQTRSTRSVSKKEAEVKLLQNELEKSKAEIVELYDALVRASENTKMPSASNRKSQSAKSLK